MLEDLKNFNQKYSYAKYIVLILVCFTLGFSIGYQNRKITKVNTSIETNFEQEQKIQIAIEKAVLEERNKWEKITNEKDVTEEITIVKPDGTSISKKKVDKTKTNEEKKVEEKIIEKVVEKIIYQDKIKIEEKIVESKVVIEPIKPNYSIGLKIDYSVLNLADIKDLKLLDTSKVDYTLEGGLRVWTDLWVTGSFQINSKTIGLGIRYEF